MWSRRLGGKESHARWQMLSSNGLARWAVVNASDALLENVSSHCMHRGLGFEETERVVYFRKDLVG